MLTYHKGSAVKHVLVWGAINAIAPREGAHQAKFKLDYSGGWGTNHTRLLEALPRRLRRATTGRRLPNVVAACKAPDGSYWAAQSWPQPLPNLGFTPWTAALRANWLEVSHWTGEHREARDRLELGLRRPVPERSSAASRIAATPVYGFGTTRFGAPTDGFGSLDLSRHVQLGVRSGLAARELLRHAQPDGRLLLRLLSRSIRRRAATSTRRVDGEARPRHGREVPPARRAARA